MKYEKLLNEIVSGMVSYTDLSNKDKVRLRSITINENLQLTDKVYFRSGIASDTEKNMILEVTKGDSYTKFIADVYFSNYKKQLEEHNRTLDDAETYNLVVYNLKVFHTELENYKSTVFPIKGLNILDGTYIEIQNIILTREYLISKLKELPTIAYRNCINKKNYYTESEMDSYHDDLTDIQDFISQNHIKGEKDLINQIFRSKNISDGKLRGIEDWVEEMETMKAEEKKQEDLEDLWYSDIHQLITSLKDTTIVGESDRYIILKVEDYRDLKLLGCNSRWCFSNFAYDDDERASYFDSYSENGIIYAIYDKSDDISDYQKMYVIVSRFYVMGEWVSYYTHPEHQHDGYSDELKNLPINEHPSTFYNMNNNNLSVGDAKRVWKRVKDSFDSESDYNKMFKIITRWW
jgi:hypothetical protein